MGSSQDNLASATPGSQLPPKEASQSTTPIHRLTNYSDRNEVISGKTEALVHSTSRGNAAPIAVMRRTMNDATEGATSDFNGVSSTSGTVSELKTMAVNPPAMVPTEQDLRSTSSSLTYNSSRVANAPSPHPTSTSTSTASKASFTSPALSALKLETASPTDSEEPNESESHELTTDAAAVLPQKTATQTVTSSQLELESSASFEVERASPAARIEPCQDAPTDPHIPSPTHNPSGNQEHALYDTNVHESAWSQLREAAGLNRDEAVNEENTLEGVQSEGHNANPFDAKAHGLEDQDVPKPATAEAFRKLHFEKEGKLSTTEPTRLISYYTLHLTRGETLTKQQHQIVFDMLQSLSTIPNLTLSEAKSGSWSIWRLLNAIVGEGMSPKKPYAFPSPLPSAAACIIERIQEDSGFAEEIHESATTSTDTSNATKKRKRSDSTKHDAHQRETMDFDDLFVKDYMHNIVRAGDGKRKTFVIANKSLIRSSKVFGHNNIIVGEWWPYRLCALRDGAHGATVGGIAGDGDNGVTSIVVSGGYEDMDKDDGDIITYSGSNSHDNTDPHDPHLSLATKRMKRAIETKSPIRVLRTGGSKWHGAPSVGVRYDGLYKIMREEKGRNPKGGAYIRFVLKRQRNQDPIDEYRPTPAEKELYWKLKNSA